MVDGSKALVFGPAQGIQARRGLHVLILEPSSNGCVGLWMSSTDFARLSREEANEGVEEFKAIGRGDFRVFERVLA